MVEVADARDWSSPPGARRDRRLPPSGRSMITQISTSLVGGIEPEHVARAVVVEVADARDAPAGRMRADIDAAGPLAVRISQRSTSRVVGLNQSMSLVPS